MKERGPCVTAGKCVGSTYRKLSEETQKFEMFFGKVVQSVKEETKVIVARVGNLFKRVKTDGKLAHWEMKQKDHFARLGEELYRQKEAEVAKLFKEENVKEILEQIKTDEEKIHEIKNANERQSKRMEGIILFKHAIKELKSPEARMRRVALRVLERLGTRESIPYLVEALHDPEPDIRTRASEMIQELSEPGSQTAVITPG